MRAVMGNLLETDSDVASISDGERERTDGDGMESEAVQDINKNTDTSSTSATINSVQMEAKEPDKTVDGSVSGVRVSSNKKDDTFTPTTSSTIEVSTSRLMATNTFPVANEVFSTNSKSASFSGAMGIAVEKTKTVSPRELPPRSQLIQLKPVMCKPKLISRNSAECVSEGINKQKNPRFIPYEPYRGAVRPMVSLDESTKKQSRTASEGSTTSSSLDHIIGSISLNDCTGAKTSECSITANVNENTLNKSREIRQPVQSTTKVVHAQCLNSEKVIEKQIHALSLFKERLKIAEKDNDELHKENIRLKKLLVDSLSGDIFQGRMDNSLDQASGFSPSASESVDTLSNEIEVWRSKFLSSCVLVEQLTRENGTLNDAVEAAANIFKNIKLSSSLIPCHYEQVNGWLRTNRPTFSVTPIDKDNADES